MRFFGTADMAAFLRGQLPRLPPGLLYAKRRGRNRAARHEDTDWRSRSPQKTLKVFSRLCERRESAKIVMEQVLSFGAYQLDLANTQLRRGKQPFNLAP